LPKRIFISTIRKDFFIDFSMRLQTTTNNFSRNLWLSAAFDREKGSGSILDKNCKGLFGSLAFLQPYCRMLHSIVLVGSTAYGMHAAGSDIDVVLITKEPAFELLCEFVFEKEIEDSLAGRQNSGIEFTVLTASQVEEIFSLCSPFSYSIRHGLVLHDTGYLKGLMARPCPTIPPRDYYLKVFFESIACQYFSALKKVKDETRQLDCSVDCCKGGVNCGGLDSAAILPHLVVKMLYLTLPARGLMPLTKNDAVDFAETFYPREIATGVRKAVSCMRSREKIAYREYRLLRKTAAKLFREIVAILGCRQDVRDILKDAANATRGKYRLIENHTLRNCMA